MRISTTQIFQRGTDSMLDQQARVFKTQLQLAANKRFLSPADDPTAAAQVLGLKESISINAQYSTNAKAAQTRLESEETALDGVVNALQRARELTVRGLNGTESAQSRRGLAQEVRQLMDQVLTLANTRDSSGEYIFAGAQSLTQPFSHDGSGGFTYSGDQSQRQLQIGPSRQIAVSDSGLDVFMKIDDAAGTGYQDVFTTLYSVATEFEANTANSDRLTELDNALNNMLEMRARIGARLNAVDREEQVNLAYSVQLQSTLSDVQDLDLAEAATDLNRQTIVLQAAQQAFVRVQGLSLFNYL